MRVELRHLSVKEGEALVELRDRLRLIRLYGSKARGDASKDSDIDVLVVVDKNDPETRELVSDIAYEIEVAHDYEFLLAVQVMGEEHFRFLASVRTMFYENLEQDGIDLWVSPTTCTPVQSPGRACSLDD